MALAIGLCCLLVIVLARRRSGAAGQLALPHGEAAEHRGRAALRVRASGRSTCRWRRSARASASCPRAADAGAAELRLGDGAEPLRAHVAIALLGAIESLLCARVADGLIGDRHDPNQELMAQGIANFVAPLFGGIAVTGTIARTMTNVKSGARSPVAGIVHRVTLFA
jgi:hypothetical protein